jgi:hypothetical protein
LFICLALSSSFRCLSFLIFFYSAIIFLCLCNLSFIIVLFHYLSFLLFCSSFSSFYLIIFIQVLPSLFLYLFLTFILELESLELLAVIYFSFCIPVSLRL